jgi:hypothetical protein
MQRTVISASIAPEEYDAFLSILEDDEDFPKNYDSWLSWQSQENTKAKARGETVVDVPLSAKEFSSYCQSTAQKPSFSMLGVVAVYKSRK